MRPLSVKFWTKARRWDNPVVKFGVGGRVAKVFDIDDGQAQLRRHPRHCFGRAADELHAYRQVHEASAECPPSAKFLTNSRHQDDPVLEFSVGGCVSEGFDVNESQALLRKVSRSG